jgi:hypothetical protein
MQFRQQRQRETARQSSSGLSCLMDKLYALKLKENRFGV